VTTPEIIMWLVVGCVGIPAAIQWRPRLRLGLRNPTALALTISWLVGQAYYLKTGDGLALSEYMKADIAVVAFIIAKGIVRAGRNPWPAITPWDAWILALFFFGAWPVYVSTLGDKYWALYFITTAQFLLAGAEPLANRRAAHRLARREALGANIVEFSPAYSRRAKRHLAPSYRSAAIGGGGGG
jgi:hypothetical protein